MNSSDLAAIIAHGSDELGIDLPSGSDALFQTYYNFLDKQGECVNLTAITGIQDVARLHFLDSIALLKTTPFNDSRVIDIGSGAGFPGVPLKIAAPEIELTLLDSSGKRIRFLSDLVSLLDLDVNCVHERAELAANNLCLREHYDVAVSRAVAHLNVLCELCLPFVCVGGLFIAMKGTDPSEEIAGAGNAIKILGAVLQDCIFYTVPGTDVKHCAVLIRKTTPTPVKFPRRFSRIKSSPL